MDGGAGSGKPAAFAVLSRSEDPVAPTSEAPASVAAPLRNSRLSTKLFREGFGNFSLGMIFSPGNSLRLFALGKTTGVEPQTGNYGPFCLAGKMPAPSRNCRDGAASTKPSWPEGFVEAVRILGGQLFSWCKNFNLS